MDLAATVFLEKAKGRVALQDGLFPEPEGAAAGFISGDELVDGLNGYLMREKRRAALGPPFFMALL